MAHMLDEPGAAAELTRIGPRTPLLHDDQVFFFAYGPDQATALRARRPGAPRPVADPR